eukprot:5787711-Prymnesium_polylepis.1
MRFLACNVSSQNLNRVAPVRASFYKGSRCAQREGAGAGPQAVFSRSSQVQPSDTQCRAGLKLDASPAA